MSGVPSLTGDDAGLGCSDPYPPHRPTNRWLLCSAGVSAVVLNSDKEGMACVLEGFISEPVKLQ